MSARQSGQWSCAALLIDTLSFGGQQCNEMLTSLLVVIAGFTAVSHAVVLKNAVKVDNDDDDDDDDNLNASKRDDEQTASEQ
ncbi:hypothetical protein TYRP_016180 [Tyrophagus putrescentiae]|nr:hypothetical protein TYRP_016180 [Tyrophagus putrescentiae]